MLDIEKIKKIIELTFGEDINYEIETQENQINVKVDSKKIAIMIGKGGRNAHALKSLIKVYNKLHNTNFYLNIVEA